MVDLKKAICPICHAIGKLVQMRGSIYKCTACDRQINEWNIEEVK